LLAQPGYESNSVTAFSPPDGVSAGTMLAMMRSDYNVEAQGGQAHLADRLVRVGHMGWAHEADIREAVAAVQDVAARLQQAASPRPVTGAAIA
jgi:aspartate aminotransferase-like enzyme